MSANLNTATAIPDSLAVIPDAVGLLEKVVLLEILAEDINGPNTFSVESAAYGYIERHWRLVVPSTMKSHVATVTAQSKLKEPTSAMNFIRMMTIAYWNFVRLVNGNVEREKAFFVAIYRARLVSLGYLEVEKESRSVTVDEVDFLDEALDFHAREYLPARDARPATSSSTAIAARVATAYATAWDEATTDAGTIVAYMEHGTDARFKRFLSFAMAPAQLAVIKHVVFAAQQYAAMTYLVFRQHGHHYKTEFENKFNVLWKATTIEASTSYPGHEIIHRLAIHSFGVKVLHQKFFLNMRRDKLAETFVERSDVAPCGTAPVATCNAAINLMRSLPIWQGLYDAYAAQINTLAAQAVLLKQAEAAIRFHKNARLFGETPVKMDIELANALAPIAKGFIDSLGEKADMAGQKSLDKRANQNPVMVKLVASVVRQVTRRISAAGDIAAALPTSGVPAIEGKKQTRKGKQPLVQPPESEEDYESAAEEESEEEE